MVMKMNRNALYFWKNKKNNKNHKRNRKAPHALILQNRECSCSFLKKGSLTVEASFCGTAFFLAIFALLYLFRIGYTYEKMQLELANAVQEYECYGTKLTTVKMFFSNGILLHWDEDKQICSVQKTERIPYLGSRFFKIHWYQQLRTSTYEGVSMVPTNTSDGKIVYLAENATVYHTREDCVYLKPRIQEVSGGNIDSMRNQSGGRYKTCHLCSRGKELTELSVAYITPYGDRWHISRTCSGLKRTIRSVPISEVGLPACSKCR